MEELKARKNDLTFSDLLNRNKKQIYTKNKSWCPEWGHIQEHSAKRAIRAIVQNARRLLYCKITRQITAAPIYKITLHQYRVCRFQEKDAVWTTNSVILFSFEAEIFWTTNSVTFGYNWTGPRSHLGAMPFWAPRNLVPDKFGPRKIWASRMLVPAWKSHMMIFMRRLNFLGLNFLADQIS